MSHNDCDANITNKEENIVDTTSIVIVSSGLVLSVIAALLSIFTRRYHSCLHRLSLYIVLAVCLRTALMLLGEVKNQDPVTLDAIDAVNMYSACLLVFLTCWASVYIMSLAFFEQKLNNTKCELIGGIIVVLCPVPLTAAIITIDIVIADGCSMLYLISSFCLDIPAVIGILFAVCSQCTVVGVFIATTARAGIHRKYRIKALQGLLPLMAQVLLHELGVCFNLAPRLYVIAVDKQTFINAEIYSFYPFDLFMIALVTICNITVDQCKMHCYQAQGTSLPNTYRSDHTLINDQSNTTVPSYTHYVVKPEATDSEVTPLVIKPVTMA